MPACKKSKLLKHFTKKIVLKKNNKLTNAQFERVKKELKKQLPKEKGIKLDNGKLRWDLLPINEVEEIVKVLTFGAKKYGENNWHKVENANNRYYAAALRHIIEYRKGNLLDDETKLSHLSHAICCLLFLSWFQKENINEK